MISQIWRRRWARGLSRGRESSNRLAQNDWIRLANGSIRLADGWRLQAHGTTLLGSGTPAGTTSQADGADGWWDMGDLLSRGAAGAALSLYLLR